MREVFPYWQFFHNKIRKEKEDRIFYLKKAKEYF